MGPTELNYQELELSVIQQIEKQLKQSGLGVLATSEDDFVTARVLMMINKGLNISFFTPVWSRKFKQLSVNNNVSIVINNIQIDGTASISGRTNDVKNEWFFKKFEEGAPEIFQAYRDLLQKPDNIYRVVEVIPKRIAVYTHGQESIHLDVLNVNDKKALRHNLTFGIDYTLDY